MTSSQLPPKNLNFRSVLGLLFL